MLRFGLLTYQTRNLGDDIQSLAARRLLPQVDFHVDREALDTFEGTADDEHRILLNGWFMQRPDRWPPSDRLTPLVISFHLAETATLGDGASLPPAETLLRGENLAYLRRVAPIGARDLSTLRRLQEHGVEAYFSGCLTLTLPERDPAKAEDYVAVVDLPRQLVKACRRRTSSPLRLLTHDEPGVLTTRERSARAEELLASYRRARCVVTTRLHVALPCLAMGVPVLLVRTQPDDPRFSGLDALVRCSTPEDVLARRPGFDLEEPHPNPDHHLRYRRLLLDEVGRFVAQGRSAPPGVTDRAAVATAWGEIAALRAELTTLRHENAELSRGGVRRFWRALRKRLGRRHRA